MKARLPIVRPSGVRSKASGARSTACFQVGSWRLPFGGGLFDVQPLWRGEIGKVPAVDIVDTDKAYEITAELPGMDESNIDVKFADGTLTIKGEKRDDKEEKKKGYYLSERRYGVSSGRSGCRTGSTPTGSRRTSRTACSRSLCRRHRRRRRLKRRSRSRRREFRRVEVMFRRDRPPSKVAAADRSYRELF
jgi:Hsp20/alpha crystallin family